MLASFVSASLNADGAGTIKDVRDPFRKASVVL
jgi:hypothetical protein